MSEGMDKKTAALLAALGAGTAGVAGKVTHDVVDVHRQMQQAKAEAAAQGPIRASNDAPALKEYMAGQKPVKKSPPQAPYQLKGPKASPDGRDLPYGWDAPPEQPLRFSTGQPMAGKPDAAPAATKPEDVKVAQSSGSEQTILMNTKAGYPEIHPTDLYRKIGGLTVTIPGTEHSGVAAAEEQDKSKDKTAQLGEKDAPAKKGLSGEPDAS